MAKKIYVGSDIVGTTDASDLVSGTVDPARLPPIGPEFSVAASDAIEINFSQDRVITRSASGAVAFTGSNYSGGSSATVRIVSGAADRGLSFPAGWVFVSFKPTDILANKTGILTVTAFGSSESDVVAAYAVEG